MTLPTPGVTPANWGQQMNDHITAIETRIARRGGTYASPANALAGATVTYVVLSTSSGDTDLINAGDLVIPTGAAGLWAFSATWASGFTQTGRAFLDINVNNVNADIVRTSIVVGEDRTTASLVRPLAVGDRVRFAVYAQSPGTSVTPVKVYAFKTGA